MSDDKPKFTNLPDRIYLNVGDDFLPFFEVDFRDLEGVTWCADSQGEFDIEYVRAAPTEKVTADASRDDVLAELYYIAREKSKRDFLDIARAALQPSEAAEPVPYDGLTEEFTEEVARLANDATGIREAVQGALASTGACITPSSQPVEQRAASTEAAAGEPIYQTQMVGDSWCDVSREEYERIAKLSPQWARVIYTAPPDASGQNYLRDMGRTIEQVCGRPEDASGQKLTSDDADMFWPEHDGEQMHHSLDDAVTAAFEDSGAKAGDLFTFTCAARLPKVQVRIIEVTENGFEWDEIRASDSATASDKEPT